MAKADADTARDKAAAAQAVIDAAENERQRVAMEQTVEQRRLETAAQRAEETEKKAERRDTVKNTENTAEVRRGSLRYG